MPGFKLYNRDFAWGPSACAVFSVTLIIVEISRIFLAELKKREQTESIMHVLSGHVNWDTTYFNPTALAVECKHLHLKEFTNYYLD